MRANRNCRSYSVAQRSKLPIREVRANRNVAVHDDVPGREVTNQRGARQPQLTWRLQFRRSSRTKLPIREVRANRNCGFFQAPGTRLIKLPIREVRANRNTN